MQVDFLYHVPASLIAFMVFFLIILSNWLGFRWKHIQKKKHPDAEIDNLGPIEGSLLGLMALLLAFSFGTATTKFEKRREFIVEEANAIGIVIRRSDLYPDSTRTILRADLNNYVESRIGYYEAGVDEQKNEEELEKGSIYAEKIWKIVADDAHYPDSHIRSRQMIPAVNEMIDINESREAARLAHVPQVILLMLILLTLTAGFLVGYGQKSKKRNLVMTIAFPLMVSLALYLVLELDRPRRGIINIDKAQQQMIHLRNLLK